VRLLIFLFRSIIAGFESPRHEFSVQAKVYRPTVHKTKIYVSDTSGKKFQIVIILAGIRLTFLGMTPVRGGVSFTGTAADMLHLRDLLLRVSGGAVQDRDFSTRLGSWAVLLTALLHRAGMGLGMAAVSA